MSSNTKTLFEAGITASFTKWGIAAPTAGYLGSANVAMPSTTYGTANVANLQKIWLQQWIDFYPNGLQGWSNWRRTNYPVLTPAPDGGGLPIPRRYMYGTNDYSLNEDSVKAAVVRQWGAEDQDKMSSRIWWDI